MSTSSTVATIGHLAGIADKAGSTTSTGAFPMLSRFISAMRSGAAEREMRRQLARLDGHILRDIGLSEDDLRNM